MNGFVKTVVASILCLSLGLGSACAENQPVASDSLPIVVLMSESTAPQAAQAPMEFSATNISYTSNGFVLVNSIDNAIDWLVREGDTLHRVGRYVVDKFKGRHDVVAILRPVSVRVIENNIVFLATAQDSAYLGVLTMAQVPEDGNLSLCSMQGFGCHCDAFNYSANDNELIVVGFNPTGYDINILKTDKGLEQLDVASLLTHHYHVPKQSERIQASDPFGVGLTLVAVLVVFFALVCIAVVLKVFSKAIERIQKRRDESEYYRRLANAVTASDEDVYAAIAAAIYLYEKDIHDEEDTVLTIQKVERAWTPWNAKFYNMNQYFNRKGR